MKITIDGKPIHVKDRNKNIVEIADENGITITAPCFRNKKKKGCCKACVIEVDQVQQYACATKPQDGMDITYQRDDLASLRKERLATYAKNMASNELGANQCNNANTGSPFNMTSSCGCTDSSCCD